MPPLCDFVCAFMFGHIPYFAIAQSPLAPAVPVAPPLVRPLPADLSFDKFVQRYETDLEQRQVCVPTVLKMATAHESRVFACS